MYVLLKHKTKWSALSVLTYLILHENVSNIFLAHQVLLSKETILVYYILPKKSKYLEAVNDNDNFSKGPNSISKDNNLKEWKIMISTKQNEPLLKN